MTKRWILAAGAAVLATFAGRALASEDLEPDWNHGIRLVSEDGSVSLRLGGRVQFDGTFQRGDDPLLADLGTELNDGHEFRRIQAYFTGVFDDRTEFKVQLDFAGGRAAPRDVWVGLRNLPGLGRLRIGQMFEPQGLDAVLRDGFTTFVEPGLPSALAAGRRTGIRATNTFGLLWASAMVSRNSDEFGAAAGDGVYNATGRLAVVPVNEDGGRRLLHLAVSGSLRDPDGTVSYSSTPENNLAPEYVDTGDLASDEVVVWGLEAAATHEQFSLQGELLRSRVKGRAGSADASLGGWYVQGSWFLTGESRPYGFRDEASFLRLVPGSNYGQGGWGAWELAARLSSLDLNDRGADVAGGRLDDVTIGLNWYQSPNFRWMANYIYADLEDSGASHAGLFRVAADF
jgi:phosphate-selective porin OprO/OprP